MDVRAGHVSVNGIAAAYADAGQGDDVLVLIHGHPFDRPMWRGQVEAASQAGWRVIAPDLRGYGETTMVPGKTRLEVFAGDVAALLDRLGVGAVVLGGLSMGGQIAMAFAGRDPGRPRARRDLPAGRQRGSQARAKTRWRA